MKEKSQGFWSVFFALMGNIAITGIKAIGFMISGSGALFSEAIHSLADTINQSLLMIGLHRSTKIANDQFAYGFKKERFFWAVISACGIFFIGCGITVYHGILALKENSPLMISWIIFAILGISLVVEFSTFYYAYRELKHKNPHMSFFALLRHGDPITLAVVYEDGIALVGVVIAAISLICYILTKNPMRDAGGSILIGVLLGIMAIVLIQKNKHFLIGKSIPEKMKREVIQLLENEDIIEKVLDFKSNILDMDTYRIKCEIECNGGGLLKEMSKHNFLKNEYEEIKDDYHEFLQFCIDFTGRIPRIIGTKIDDIEKKIKTKFPQIKHIDIEIN